MTSAAQEKPTVLFVHGAWHSPAHFAPAVRAFEAAGYPTVCPCQPSYGSKLPAISMYDDAACIRAALDGLIVGDGKDVILVLHSYGGVVGSQAAHASLGREARAQRGQPGGILSLVYVTAFVLPEGACVSPPTLGPLPPFVKLDEDGRLILEDPASRFYHELPAAERAHWVGQLKPHPYKVFLSEQTYVGYERHPTAYILCEDDRMVPPERQEEMVLNLRAGSRVARLPSGHSPFLSMPKVFLETVVDLAGV